MKNQRLNRFDGIREFKHGVKVSLRIKLTLAFLLVTLTLFGLFSILANQILEKQFKSYVINEQEQRNREAVTLISNGYQEWGNTWDADGLERIGVNALGQGLMLRIKTVKDEILWDANVHNSGMCAMILENMAASMLANNIHVNGGYLEKNYVLEKDGIIFGSVDVGYYGPYYYTDNDIQFLKTLNRLLFLAVGFATLISVVMGIFMAKRISIPLNKIINTTREIAKGNYHNRVNASSTTKEISELAGAVNSLVTSLENQERFNKRMTADVAHELRTPLSTLQSHLEAMIDGIWKADQERLTSCHEETIRLTKLVGNLENLAKYEGDNLKLDLQPIRLTDLINKVRINFEPMMTARQLKCDMHIEPENAIVTADSDLLSQVLINIISNAIKYTDEGGTITIRTAVEAQCTKIMIKDSGIGIAPENIPFIFERFYRVDTSRNRQTGGAGIGLAIVKSIVDAHGGTVLVESELGVGSQFTVILLNR